MKPMWAIELKAIKRTILFWNIAAKVPTKILNVPDRRRRIWREGVRRGRKGPKRSLYKRNKIDIFGTKEK